MSKITVTVSKDMASEYSEPILASLHRYSWLLPTWLHSLYIRFDNSINCPMQIVVHEEYRHAFIDVGGEYLDQTQDKRDSDVAHELCHLYTTPLIDLARRIVIENTDEKVAGAVKEEIRRVLERVTNDLERAIVRGKLDLPQLDIQ